MPFTLSPSINNIRYVIRNPYDIIESTILNGQQWNYDILTILQTYIKERKLNHFVNVGAHIGTESLPISLCIKKVTAIEAYPSTFNQLCQNIEFNNIKNIQTYNIAVGNSDDTAYFMATDKIDSTYEFNRIENNRGGMTVITNTDIQEKSRSAHLVDMNMQVKMQRFDTTDIDNFDIMLIDIEGCEYDFLLGAKEKINKNKPIIIIEIWNNNKMKAENMKHTQEDIISYFKGIDYKLIKNIEDDFIFEPI
jgi:FkbM family methyltransferase